MALLACMAQRPTLLEQRAVDHYVAYLYGSREMGITYYEGPPGANIRTTVPLRLYTDTGENQHLNGAGHWGIAVFLGSEEDNDSGAIVGISQKANGVVGESVPVNEIMGAAAGVKVVMVMKYLLEEWSGATQHDLDTTDMMMEGSAGPTACMVAESVAQGVHNSDMGHLGDAAMFAAARALSNQPPVSVYGDNQGVVDNVNHISYNSKGLRRVTRIVAHLQSLVQQDIIKVFKVAREGQHADPLSKQETSPVRNAAALQRLLGKHPKVAEYVRRVQMKCNKRRGQQQEGEEMEVSKSEGMMEVYAAQLQSPEEIEVAIQRMSDSVPFLASSSGKASRIMAMMGYDGLGGLGSQGQGETAPLIPTRKYTGRGIGCSGSGRVNQRGEFVQGSSGIGPDHGEVYGAHVAGMTDSRLETEKVENYTILLSTRIRTALLKMIPAERWLFRMRLKTGPFQDLLVHKEEDEGTEEVFIAERMRRALIKLTKEERWLFSTELRGQQFCDRLIAEEGILDGGNQREDNSHQPQEQGRPSHSYKRGSKGGKRKQWKRR